MTVPTPGEASQAPTPTPTPELNEDGTPKVSVETPKGSEDIDFDKELQDLETGIPATPPAKVQRTELEKAEFTAKSTLKRIKELGGDPAKILADEGTPPAPAPEPSSDTGEFVTKLDLAQEKAEKIAKSPAEVKVIMWWVKNKGMSVEDAHHMANKGRIKKLASEITRANTTVHSNGGGGAGQRTPETKTQKMSESQEQKLQAAGLVFDQATNSYAGKKTRVRHDGAKWVSERLVNGKWVTIPNASQYDNE